MTASVSQAQQQQHPHTVAAAPTAVTLGGRSAAEVDRLLGAAAVPLKAFVLLCQHNSDVAKLDDERCNLTYYHSTQEPPVTLEAYLERISRYSECGPEGILLALRLAGRCHTTAGVTLTRLSAHRVTITALTLGVKMHMDRFRSNRTVAKAGGLRLKELNGLEYAMFRELGFRTVVTNEEMEHMVACSQRALERLRQGRVADAAAMAEDAFCGHPRPMAASGTEGSPTARSVLRRTDSASSLKSLDGTEDDESPQALYKPSPAGAPSQDRVDPSLRSFADLASGSFTARASGPPGSLRQSGFASMAAASSTQQQPHETNTFTTTSAGTRLRRFPAALTAAGETDHGVSACNCRSFADLGETLDASTRSNASEAAAQMRFRQRVAAVWRPGTASNDVSTFLDHSDLSLALQ
jgi:hypothetical protein